jgi:predicted esterase
MRSFRLGPFLPTFVVAVLGLSLVAAQEKIGSIRCDIWHNLEGGQITETIADGELSVAPGETRSLDQFELNPAPEEPQACALRGYVIPPATGDYTFVISGDDTALLYLSKDSTYSAVRIIATVPSYTGVRDFKHFTAQTSQPIKLIAGKHYFIEALLKNDQGASHVSVGWTLPDGTDESPIPGNRLMPVIGKVPAPAVQTEPPKLTLNVNPALDLSPGFHKYPTGAHVELKGVTMDMSYLLYLPKEFDKTHDKRPLLIFLHGNSHQGTDLEGCLNEGPAQYLHDDPKLADWFPMIALFPQLPDDWRWDSPGAPQIVNALIKAICEKLPRVDRNRIYLTGLSMGGKGTWLTALDSPKTFAAITTFSAVAVRPNIAKTRLAGLKNIHIICGGDDGDFAAGSKQMYEALMPALGSRVQLTTVEHEGHGVWGDYYPKKDIYQELMKFSK